ncbi:hypothetical protein ACRALDRAFT_210605 [Sodiomyces alcalophilus JCM 7366]|uniref:uncharacterized protein n=1 Tax=Sodiomyces alcalophilus JCM 7366 TaxID=591952 RepID=UPI0039B591CD
MRTPPSLVFILFFFFLFFSFSLLLPLLLRLQHYTTYTTTFTPNGTASIRLTSQYRFMSKNIAKEAQHSELYPNIILGSRYRDMRCKARGKAPSKHMGLSLTLPTTWRDRSIKTRRNALRDQGLHCRETGTFDETNERRVLICFFLDENLEDGGTSGAHHTLQPEDAMPRLIQKLYRSTGVPLLVLAFTVLQRARARGIDGTGLTSDKEEAAKQGSEKVKKDPCDDRLVDKTPSTSVSQRGTVSVSERGGERDYVETFRAA